MVAMVINTCTLIDGGRLDEVHVHGQDLANTLFRLSDVYDVVKETEMMYYGQSY